MNNKLLEKILWLTREGYTVSIRPSIGYESWIEIRLSKDNHTVAQNIDPDIRRHTYAWDSDEDWILYNLTCLQFQYEKYVRKLKEIEL